MRPIDADKLIEWIKKTYCEGCDNYNGMRCKACPNDDEIGDIDSAPTIDAVNVVRCKDCKHCYEDGEHVKFNVCELNHNKVQSDDWFCADGERKDQ